MIGLKISFHEKLVLFLFFIGISAEKPKYEVGSAAKLTFSSRKVDHPKTAAVWKVDDDDDDFINEDDLLDENDKLKPNLSNLKGL